MVKTIPGAVSGTSKQEIPDYNGVMDADTEKTAKPRRRWLRFSLWTLLIVVTVLAVPLGWVGWKRGQVRKERATIAWIEEAGGDFLFPSYKEGTKSWWKLSTDKWFGERVFWSLKELNLGGTQVSIYRCGRWMIY